MKVYDDFYRECFRCRNCFGLVGGAYGCSVASLATELEGDEIGRMEIDIDVARPAFVNEDGCPYFEE